MQNRSGVFLVFEGGDGAGKSSQLSLLSETLTAGGHQVLCTREPGGTELGETLRRIVLAPPNSSDGASTEAGSSSAVAAELSAKTEALLFSAARAQHCAEVIRPALAAGKIVISDRFIDSSVVYQGIGRGLGTQEIHRLNAWASDDLIPQLTIVLDIPPYLAQQRREQTPQDRIEAEPTEFHERIRQGFLDLAQAAPERYLVIDATADRQVIHRRILDRVQELL